MGEEAIPFVMILVPMFIAMGYDAVVGIMCSYVSTQIGFGSSWQNPFGLAVAQGVAVFRSCPVQVPYRYGSSSQDLRSSSQCATQ